MTDAINTQDLNTEATAGTNAPEAAPKEVLTAKQRAEQRIVVLRERIAKDNTELAELEERLAGIDKLDSIKVGTNVVFNYGRGENVKRVVGAVSAIDNSQKNPRYKVFFGEGFDADVTVIYQSQVLDVISA